MEAVSMFQVHMKVAEAEVELQLLAEITLVVLVDQEELV